MQEVAPSMNPIWTWRIFAPIYFAQLAIVGRACQSVGCMTLAHSEVFWPGTEGSIMCAHHTRALSLVAEAMGFDLACRSIPERRPIFDEKGR